MALPPNTTIIIRARLFTLAGTNLTQWTVLANVLPLTLAQQPTPEDLIRPETRGLAPAPAGVVEIGRAAPAADGSLLIRVLNDRLAAAEYHSRIQLAVLQPRITTPRVIAEIPLVVRGANIDFGDIEVRQDVVFALGDTQFYGFNRAVVDKFGETADLRQRIDKLTEQLTQTTAQVTTLTAANSELKQSNDKLRTDVDTANQGRAAAENRANELSKRVDSLNAQVNSLSVERDKLRTDLGAANQGRAAAENRADELSQRVDSLNGQVNSLSVERDKLRTDLDTANQDREDANKRARTLAKQVDVFDGQIVALTADKARVQAEFSALQQIQAGVSSELNTAKDQRDQAQAAAKVLKESLNTRSTLGDLVENVGTQLRTAQQSLAGSESPFRVGRLSMELKVVPSEHGTAFNFPTQDEMQRAPGDGLSRVNIDFAPAVPTGPVVPADSSLAEVPDLAGTTEVMARRMAGAAGLALQTGFLAVPRTAGGVSQRGRVVKQIPAPRTRVPAGTTVTALFGMEE